MNSGWGSGWVNRYTYTVTSCILYMSTTGQKKSVLSGRGMTGERGGESEGRRGLWCGEREGREGGGRKGEIKTRLE